ncbi:VOC family protein [Paraburkholderia fungorum]|uniref:VOC family protein n=1 Tax=Paraburkholderia fungorum TaxID=134537 RepID=UPI0038BBB6E8
MQKIAPCLWFDGNAEEAARFYTGVFGNSRIATTMHHTDAGPGPKGSVLAVTFELEGQEFMALNGGPQFTFTPAISLFVHCGSQQEIDSYWAKLCDGGAPQQCGWVQDRFGVSWQIVPDALGRMLRDPDAGKAKRVMEAMMDMVKLDIGELERAYRGA